ncbi:MAG: helix-turn-helix domain-containing protein [Myxococcales bacterium]
MKPLSEQSYYELLDVGPEATEEQIDAGFNKAMAWYGPDSIAVYTLVPAEEAKALVKRIEDAYLVLMDPAARKAYDVEQGFRKPEPDAVPVVAPTPAAPEPPRKALAWMGSSPWDDDEDELPAPPVPVTAVSAPVVAAEGPAPEAKKPARQRTKKPKAEPVQPELVPVVEGAPEPVKAVEPAPEPVKAIEPAPVRKPEPVKVAEPEPAPEPKPEPVKAVEPAPEPMPEQVKAIEPAPEPKPEPVKVVEPAPEPMPEQVKAAEPAPEPKPEPVKAIEPAPEPTPEPVKVVEPAPEPMPEPVKAAEPAPEPMPEPVKVVEPAPKPEPVKAIEPAPEPKTEPVKVVEPAPEPMPEPVKAVEPAPEPMPEPAKVVEPAPDPKPEPKRPEPATSIERTDSVRLARVLEERAKATAHAPEPAEPSPGPANAIVRASPVASRVKSDPPERQASPSKPPNKGLELPPDAVYTGELLRRIRESRGLSQRELSDRTKISLAHIENIEADHYGAMPVTVYLRGFLMSMARELKLDPLKVSKSYLELVGKAKQKG